MTRNDSKASDTVGHETPRFAMPYPCLIPASGKLVTSSPSYSVAMASLPTIAVVSTLSAATFVLILTLVRASWAIV
jgi:hypothetical protein